jgi:peptidyl-prolyl cis-trans isomerase A (cyclophilin A)
MQIFSRAAVCSLVAAVVLAAPAGAAMDAKHPEVAIKTTAGTIVVQLDAVHAPITTKNFLKLVAAKKYDGAAFYRTVDKAREPQSQIDVIQGGLQPNTAPDTIPLEKTTKTGLHNTNGAIAMARTQDPNSASSEFFLDVGDNTFLDTDKMPDGNGYAAFGHVVSGMETVIRINKLPAEGENITPPVRIISMRRIR